MEKKLRLTFNFRIGLILFVLLFLSGLASYSHSVKGIYPVQVPYTTYIPGLTPDGTPYQIPSTSYTTEYRGYTRYPYRSLGSLLIVLGIIAGILTGVSVLINRRKPDEKW